MNIDVREYLRINPISVHELTLSDNDGDCFLLFPSSSDIRGYRAITQRELFKSLQKSVFGDLLDDSQDPPVIEDESLLESAIAGKFKNYIRKSEVQRFKDDFDGKLNDLESDLNTIILALRRKGILDYAGAVELQSSNARRLTWTSGIGGPIYKNMSYANGQIWCKTTDSDIPTTGGHDEVPIGTQPLRHNHYNTSAETLTGPLAEKFGGGQLIGDFTIGSKELVAYGSGFGPTTDAKASPLEHAIQETLTYPLWGQNVLDWRNPKKTHNNIPPSLNIYVRYWITAQASIRGVMESVESCEEVFKRIAQIREASQSSQIAGEDSAAESRYDSAMVCECPKYVDENLTTHDYILRLALDGEQQVNMMRQGLQMLLDIFAERTNDNLSTTEGTMKELVMRHLDYLLMPVQEFMQWYDEKTKQLDAIEGKITTIQQLWVSVPPLNYIGRIIISYTDDTEQKVVANYGGKRWRRIENFLRGVGNNDTNNIPGQKLGEEYVELRESNIPIHAHTETVSNITHSEKWTAKNKGGTAKIVNTPLMGEDNRPSVEVANVERNYQISPLEYPNKNNGNEITLPHDNLPPYMKVYIWECTELTDEEYNITGEPENNECMITWLYNGGKVGNNTRGTQTRRIGGNHSNIPSPTYDNHEPLGWKDMSGQIKTNAQILATPISGNETYVAQWQQITCEVKFNSNGGLPNVMTREYPYGSEIGYLPIPDEFPDKAIDLAGWYTRLSGGEKITPNTEVVEDTTYYAHWNYEVSEKVYVKFFHYNGNTPYKTIELAKGARIGELDTPAARTGYTFKGWFTERTGGEQVFATKKVQNNLNLYEQWIADICEITWNPNYTGGTSEKMNKEYGSKLGTLPVVNRLGYTQDGWWTSTTGGSNVTSNTSVLGDATYYAHWNLSNYTISYNLNGGSWSSGQTPRTSYNIESNKYDLLTPEYVGRQFAGWTGSNGNTPQTEVSIPKGSTGNKSYVANWNARTYTVEFNANGGTGTMADQTFTYDVYQKLRNNEFIDSIVVNFNGNGGNPTVSRLTSYREFLGWATGETGPKVYNNQQNVKNLTTETSITLYAKWGNWGKIYLPNANRAGYAFANWYTSAQGGTSVGKADDQYQPTASTTLHAHWTPKEYTVTFDPVGGTVVGQSTKPVTFNSTYGELPTATHAEYTFNGWFTQSEGGDQITANSTVTTTRNHTLYAHWEDGTMTLTFDLNQGYFDDDDTPETRRCWIGQPYSYEGNTPSGAFPTPVRNGHEFGGWYEDETWETEVKASDIAGEKDKTIIAYWIPNYYTIRYNANGGSGEMSDQPVLYGGREHLKANQFTSNTATFAGWSSSPTGRVEWEDQEEIINLSTTPGSVVNLYAIWQGEPITVRFNSNWDQYTMNFDAGGDFGGWCKRLDAGTPITPPTVTRENYDFVGWSPTPPTTMPANDVTCIAQWRQVPLTATITTNRNTATCSDIRPADATVQYSTTDSTSGYEDGNTFTLDFTSETTQTKTGWFKISYPGITDGIYKVQIKQTYSVTKNWSDWSAWAGPASGTDVYAYAQILKRNYGEGNYEIEVLPGYYARNRHVINTSSSTSYSSTVTRVQ